MRITATGEDVSGLDVDVPSADGVSFGGRSSSTSISSSWVGGRRRTHRSAELALRYTAFQPGSLSLGPFVVSTGSRSFDLGSVEIAVDGDAAQPPPGASGRSARPAARPISVETEVDADGRLYAGMPVTVRYYLRTRYPLREISPSWESPRRGVARLVGTPEELRWQPDDAMFSRAHILTLQMVPACPGSVMVPRVSVDAVAFASGSPLGSSVTVRSDSTYVAVHPVPREGRPDSFRGAVGELELSLEAAAPSPGGGGREVVLRASGRGAAGLDDPPPVTVRGPARLEPVGSDGSGKSRRWTYLLCPEGDGRAVLGPDSVPWLDPRSGEYRWAAYGGDTLTVEAPAPTESPVEPPAAEEAGGTDPVLLAGGLVLLAAAASGILVLRSRRRERSPSLKAAEDPDELLSAMESGLSRLLGGGEGYIDGRELRRLLALKGVDRVTARSVVACWRRAEALVSGSGRHMLERVREDAVNAMARLEEEVLDDGGPSKG